MRRHHILIPLAALLATSPLIFGGCSCGHDFTFHLQSWLDAGSQLRHGSYPHWAFTPAFHAGEPRFVFYPPLSWMLGAMLCLLFPIAAVPAIFTFLALTAAGFSMHRLAAAFVSPNAALIAATVYLANPYMLFNAFERTAYAELLAAAWVPLLFLAALRRRPTIAAIAIPLALLWLTNAPAAVMSSYTLALLAVFRILDAFRQRRAANPNVFRLTLTCIAGTLLGLALAAFYLIPAAFERHYVQIAMAIIFNMRIEDNFLFGHTADGPHNAVLHTASVLAVTLLVITAALLLATSILRRKTGSFEATPDFSFVIPEGNLRFLLATITVLIAILLTPPSLPVWRHLPELAFLQFSWRLLTILAPVLALSVALLCNTLRAPASLLATNALAAATAILLTALCIHLYRQPCESDDTPTALAQAFAAHHGVPPTDEYTPTNADNDVVRPDEPAYWLASTPNAFAPNTTPNPGSTDPNFSDGFPAGETISATPPSHFTVHTDMPEYLILNLRDYPNWQITDISNHQAVNHQAVNHQNTQHPIHIPRDDGLLAIPLSEDGEHVVNITYRRSPDQTLGLIITLLALLALALHWYRSDRNRRLAVTSGHRLA